MTLNFFAYFSFWYFATLLDLVGGKCNTTPVNKPVLKPKPIKKPVVKPKPDKCYAACSNPEFCIDTDFRAENLGCTFCCKYSINTTHFYHG